MDSKASEVFYFLEYSYRTTIYLPDDYIIR